MPRHRRRRALAVYLAVRYRRPLLLALLVILALLVAALAVALHRSPLERARDALRRPGGTAPGVKTWAAENEATKHTWTVDEARDIARRMDYLPANQNSFRSYTDAMHDSNKVLVLAQYMNASYAQKNQGPDSGAYPRDLYATDAAGNPVRSVGYGNWLMRFWDDRWYENRCASIKKVLGVSHYDAAMWDMLGLAPIRAGYGTAIPVNPATGAPFTAAEYQQAIAAHAGRLTDCLHAAGKLSTGNVYTNGATYLSGAKVMADRLDLGIAEGWFNAGNCRYYSETAWRQQVDMLTDLAARDRQAAVMVKVWCGSWSLAQKRKYEQYAFATFLLGNDGRSYYHANLNTGTRLETVNPLWNTALGQPTGPLTRTAAGLYVREYEQATVQVNPAGVARGGLAPYTGQVLLK